MIKKLLSLLYSIRVVIVIVINVDNIICDSTVLVLEAVAVFKRLEGAARPVAGPSVVLAGILHVSVPNRGPLSVVFQKYFLKYSV